MKKLVIILVMLVLTACGTAISPGDNSSLNTDDIKETNEISGSKIKVDLLKSVKTYYPDGKLGVIKEYTYDEDGNILNIDINADYYFWNYEESYTYEYTEEKIIRRCLEYNISDEFDYEHQMINENKNDSNEYDENGRLVKSYFNYGGTIYTYEYKYEFDDHGNLIKEISSGLDSRYNIMFINEMVYEYDNNNHCIKVTYFNDGEECNYETYEYDKFENVYIYENCWSDGSLRSRIDHEYDENHNLIKRTAYDNTTLVGYEEYEYVSVLMDEKLSKLPDLSPEDSVDYLLDYIIQY